MARYKKKTNKGWIIFGAVVAVLLAAVIAVSIVSKGFTNFDKFNRKQSGSQATATDSTLYAPDAGLLVNQTEANGIMLLSSPLDMESFEAYSIDENAEAVKTITARFTPADTTLQKVDYTAAWTNSSSTWATGKDVNDYLTLSQSEDGSLDCAVSALQAFGEQITITCTARPLEEGDWVPTATCKVDYYKRINECDINFQGVQYDSDGEIYSEFNTNLKNHVFKYINEFDENTDTYTYEYTAGIVPGYGDGTVYDQPNSSTLNISISISDNIAANVKSAAGLSTLSSYQLVTNGECNGLFIKTAIENMLGGAANVQDHRVALYNVFKEAYDKNQAALTFEITFSSTGTKNEYTYTSNNLLNPIALGIKATGLDIGGDIIL